MAEHQYYYPPDLAAYPAGYDPDSSSAPTQHPFAHAHPYVRYSYDSAPGPGQLGLSGTDQHYYAPPDAYPPAMQRPYVHPYAEPPNPQFASGYTHSPAQSQPSLPQPRPQHTVYGQASMAPPRNYYQREALDKLHMHPHAQRAVMSVPSQQPTTPSSAHPEPPAESAANGYSFVPTVPGPLSGPVLAPEFQQSLAYSRSPVSVIPSTLPAVPSTSRPSSSRQSDSTGSISPRAVQDNSLPAPIFSSTSPVVNQSDILVTDPSVKNRKFVVERDITCIKVAPWFSTTLLSSESPLFRPFPSSLDSTF
ncbi:hypothetical protein RhiJN_14179 [Ceratobasidium sp. AG-Ba]|nr:hypothetical protein RhiJN_14179 [Ceratobasidium sp. AG-Ba]